VRIFGKCRFRNLNRHVLAPITPQPGLLPQQEHPALRKPLLSAGLRFQIRDNTC